MIGKVAIITGAARGMGKGLAETLLQNGAKVCISDVQKDLGHATVEELGNKHGADRVMFHPCDVTKDDQFEDLLKKTGDAYGQVEILVNNAGKLYESHTQSMIDVNVMAVIKGTMLGIKYMGKHNGGTGGSIINLGSIVGLLPADAAPLYTTTKHAVVGFTRAIGGMSHKAYGIRTNVLCPSFTDTDLIKFTPEDLAKGKLYGPDLETRLPENMKQLDGQNLLPVSEVARCFMELVKDDTLSGQVMLVSSKGSGIASNMPFTVEQFLDTCVPNKI